MNRLRKISFLKKHDRHCDSLIKARFLISAFMMLSAVPCLAQGSLIPSVNTVQTVRNPTITVTAGAQIGSNNNINSSQKSTINVYNVTQVGPKSTAVVKQNGSMNSANINQISPSNPIGW